MCENNTIKTQQGNATDCNTDTACDSATYVPNENHTACGKFLPFSRYYGTFVKTNQIEFQSKISQIWTIGPIF